MPRGHSWFAGPHAVPYGWRCRWFPWLPRWWWTGIYGPATPYAPSKERELAWLEDHAQVLEATLAGIRRRLDDLETRGETT